MAKIIKNGIEYCGNTDNSVTQTIVTPSGFNGYYVLFSNSPTTDTETAGVNKHSNFTYNPLLQRLYSPTVAGDIFTCNTLVVNNTSDISSQYTFTKTSGAWNADTTLYAYRTGKFVSIRLRLAGTGTQVNAGSDAFVGTISGGPMPLVETHDINFAGSSAIVSRLATNGSITTRVLASNLTVTSSNGVVLTFNFLT